MQSIIALEQRRTSGKTPTLMMDDDAPNTKFPKEIQRVRENRR